MGLRVRRNRAPHPGNICPLSKCMALIGGAWAAEVIWCLSGGPRRFGELRIDLPAVTAKVLAGRLRDLQSKGVVSRRPMPTSPPSVEYELTALGAQLLPAIRAIAEIGDKLKFGRALEPGHRDGG